MIASPEQVDRVFLPFEKQSPSSNDVLKFEFTVRYRSGPSGDQVDDDISCLVTWSAAPGQAFRIGNFRLDTPVPYQNKYSNGDKINGSLVWRQLSSTPDGPQVFGDISLYSRELRETFTFSGSLVQFGPEPPYPPHPPHPPLPPDPSPTPLGTEAGATLIQQRSLRADELFPFIYMQVRPGAPKTWPDLPKGARENQFFDMPAEAQTGKNRFWTDLKTAFDDGDGKAMRVQAAAYVDATVNPDGEPPSDGFVTDTSELAPPYDAFGQLEWILQGNLTWIRLDELVTEYFGSWEILATLLTTKEAKVDLTRVWNSVIALMICLGYDHAGLGRLIRLLTVAHLFERAIGVGVAAFARPQEQEDAETEESDLCDPMLQQWQAATMILPAIFPLPAEIVEPHVEPQETPGNISSTIPAAPYAVASVETVNYKLTGYETGEIQRIENILVGERREQTNRSLTKSSEISSDEDRRAARARQDGRDASLDLSTEVLRTLATMKDKTDIERYDADYGASTSGKVSVSGNWQIEQTPEGGYSRSASDFARNVVEKTARRVTRQVNQTRARLSASEHETVEIDCFDNIGGTRNIRGVYRWLNKSYELEQSRLGHVLVFEVFLKDPAADLLVELEQYWNIELRPPRSPAELGVVNFECISTDIDAKAPERYYLDLLQYYNLPNDMPAPPERLNVHQAAAFSGPLGSVSLQIPSGYVLKSATALVNTTRADPDINVSIATEPMDPDTASTGPFAFSLTFNKRYTAPPAGISLLENSSDSLVLNAIAEIGETTQPNSDVEAALLKDPVAQPRNDGDSGKEEALEATSAAKSSLSVDILCHIGAETKENWQYLIFKQLEDAYATQLAEYRAERRRALETLLDQNPALIQDLINGQIYRRTRDLFYRQYRTLLLGPPGTVDEPQSLLQTALSAPRVHQFLNSVLDWDNLTAEMLRRDGRVVAGDERGFSATAFLTELFPVLSFQSFLHADRARILLPTKESAERVFLLFFRTADIWPLEANLTPCLQRDVAVVAAIKDARVRDQQSAECREKWAVTVPTSMVVLSAEDRL